MFDIDRWQEIFASIRSNILRTVLSGFTVALGLFIFVVLFGIGNGLQNAFTKGFTQDAQNKISISTYSTSIAYDGLQENREIVLKNEDFNEIFNNNKDNIEYYSPRYNTGMLVKYENESGTYRIAGTNGDERFTENRNLVEGRYINQGDISQRQYVAVIGRMVGRDLIKTGNPIGKDLNINGTMFKIVGVFSDGSENDWAERMISIPISTLQLMKKGSETIHSIQLTYNQKLTPDEAIAFGDKLEHDLKVKHRVAPKDKEAIFVSNNAKNTKESYAFIFVLALVVGFIGLGTLLAGIIGISNIMVYIVKERTQEIGVRKAIGAKPRSIVALIIQESVLITVVSGLVGTLLGVLTLKLIGNSLEKFFIVEPSVGIGLMITAFITLIIAGSIAGFVPAFRASRIKPIDALRSE